MILEFPLDHFLGDFFSKLVSVIPPNLSNRRIVNFVSQFLVISLLQFMYMVRKGEIMVKIGMLYLVLVLFCGQQLNASEIETNDNKVAGQVTEINSNSEEDTEQAFIEKIKRVTDERPSPDGSEIIPPVEIVLNINPIDNKVSSQ